MDVQDSPTIIAPENEAQPTPLTEEKSTVDTTSPWRNRFAPWWQATLAVLPTFLITRFIFLLLTYFGAVLFNVSNYSYTVVPFSTILHSWYHWDVISFDKIAAHDYSAADPTKAAFFPLYPWLERWLSVLLRCASPKYGPRF